MGAALALVAALVGGGLLEVMLSPVWAQINTDEGMETGACKEYNNCAQWRIAFSVSCAFSFAMAVITLVDTILIVLGMHYLLAFAITAFILCLDSLSLSLVAVSWMTYPKAAAIFSSVIMIVLSFFTLIVVAVTGTVLTWHLILRLEANKDQEAGKGIKTDTSNSRSGVYRAANGKVGEDGESFDIL